MCGIVGYIGNKPVYDILINGLKKLEYRGYDSSGIMIYNQKPLVKKAKGRFQILKNFLLIQQINKVTWGSDIPDGLLMALLTKLILIHTHQIQEKLRLFIME